MSFGSDSLGLRCHALAFALSTTLALGCAGKSESGGDDDSGTSGTGGTSTGGASGFGGTSGASGTTSTGGTGASSASCASLCQRAQACPGSEPLDCGVECPRTESQAASYGCTQELERYYACVARLSDVCSFDPNTECVNDVSALLGCFNGDPSARCTEGAPPTGASCTTLCERGVVCSGVASDCAAVCADALGTAATTGCAEPYQRYLDCAGTCENICNLSESDCPSSYAAYLDCFSSFCAANPTSPACI